MSVGRKSPPIFHAPPHLPGIEGDGDEDDGDHDADGPDEDGDGYDEDDDGDYDDGINGDDGDFLDEPFLSGRRWIPSW